MSNAFSQEGMLFGGRLLPITAGIMFARASVDELVKHYEGRRLAPVLGQEPVDSLESLLREMLPLVTLHERKKLLVPVEVDGYTAIFTDAMAGYDEIDPSYLMARGLDLIVVHEFPHTFDTYPHNPGRGFYGHRSFLEVRCSEPRNGKCDVRQLRLRTENARTWMLEGDPDHRPWSLEWNPDARRNVDKFTHEHLVQSAANAGLRPFDEDFYRYSEAVLLEKTATPYDNQGWVTLEMAQGREPRHVRNLITDPPPSPGGKKPKWRWR